MGKHTFVISLRAPSNARARAPAKRLLKPVMPRYKSGVSRIYFQGDAGFASTWTFTDISEPRASNTPFSRRRIASR